MAAVQSKPTDNSAEATHFRCYKCKTEVGVDEVVKIGSTKDAVYDHLKKSTQGCGWEHIGYNKIVLPVLA